MQPLGWTARELQLMLVVLASLILLDADCACLTDPTLHAAAPSSPRFWRVYVSGGCMHVFEA